MKRKSSAHKNSLLPIFIALLICLLLTSCGGTSSSGTEGDGNGGTAANASAAAQGKSGKGGGFKAEFHNARYHEDSTEGNEEVQIDFSRISNGYFGVLAESDARLKLQVFKGSDTFTYDVTQGSPQIFPLQCGDGDYTIKVMKNVSGNSYYELYVADISVKLKNPNAPYLRPNVYSVYSEESKCVKKAAEMAAGAGSESDFVAQVYDYVCKNISYDYEEAKNVASEYFPDPDEVYETRTGICIDYASLAAAMLRSQGIPTKIIFGYVAPDNLYHAWNMFYTEENGWTTVEFSVNPGEWNRIDLTFSANGANSDFIGNGKNYQDVYHY